jgi:hypothetical protein
MQYIEDLLNAKRIDIRAVLSSPCKVTIKEDGSALQVKYDDNMLLFGKRSWDPSKLTKPLTEIDRFLSGSYDNAYNHLTKYADVIKQYDIINFELISIKEQHIIKFDGDKDYKIILLSAWQNGNAITDYETLVTLADALNVDHVQQLDINKLSEELIKDLLEKADEPFELFKKYYYINDNIEGLVINFFTEEKTRTYKIQNPTFKKQLAEHLNEEKDLKNNIDCTYAYEHIMHIYEDRRNHKAVNKLDLLLDIWKTNIPYVTQQLLNNIKKISQIREKDISDILFAKNYPEYHKLYINNSQEIRELLVFIILAFQNIRIKQSLWCDMTFQTERVNVFLNKVYNDISGS